MSGLDLSDLKHFVVEPVLDLIGLSSPAAVNLVAGTAAVESACCRLKQIGGPALGLWQMEPATEDDIWDNFLDGHRNMMAVVSTLMSSVSSRRQLVWNLAYGAAMCRLLYYRVPDALPDASDAAALCAYWKTFYNTSLGAGEADAAHIALFQAAIDA